MLGYIPHFKLNYLLSLKQTLLFISSVVVGVQSDDRVALVGKDEVDVELGNCTDRSSRMPPQW